MLRSFMRSRLLGLVASLVAFAGCHGYTVTRVYGGETEEGRFISERAYAHYGRGAEAEQRGDLAMAERSYAAAAAIDPDAPAPHARLGAVVCKARGLPSARAHFERALELAADFAPALLEHARCAEAARDLPLALRLAEEAVRADPQSDETTLLYARLLEGAGRRERAFEVLHAKRLLGSRSTAVVAALTKLAVALGRPGTSTRLEASSTDVGRALAPARGAPARLDALDGALSAGELSLAHRLARAQGLELGTEALRLVLLGKPREARARAELALDAEPESADARVALALAHEAEGELSRAATVLASVPDASRAPSALGRLALLEALSRRVGLDAERAAASLGPTPGESSEREADPLLRELVLRASRRAAGAAKPPAAAP